MFSEEFHGENLRPEQALELSQQGLIEADKALAVRQLPYNHIESALPKSGSCWRRTELRAAAILRRTTYRYKNGAAPGLNASFCSISSWSSTSFFWDSAIAALGLREFDLGLAEDALRALFVYQREDGCCPTHSYEHAVGSTFLPQAPIVSRSVLAIYRQHGNIGYVREMLPKVRALFQWFLATQDQDNDGLVECRFSGQIADNSPQYDLYVAHVPNAPESWNIFLPPAASVGMNSFVYMDARCLAELYRIVEQPGEAEVVMSRAAQMPSRLEAVCWDEKMRLFQDYDHQWGDFNRSRVLHCILPLWAGIPMQDEYRRILIEENLLEPKRFYGDYPFPFLAYDEATYTPKGYWRGRVWPHTTIWMLEALWENGHHREADAAADRLITMMQQQRSILENYYSQPTVPGGGMSDYNWSSASFLYIANRRYRESLFADTSV